jgi:hypothetical protein
MMNTKGHRNKSKCLAYISELKKNISVSSSSIKM